MNNCCFDTLNRSECVPKLSFPQAACLQNQKNPLSKPPVADRRRTAPSLCLQDRQVLASDESAQSGEVKQGIREYLQ